MRLKVSKDFFVQFAEKTWISPYSVARELVEDCYDEDATHVVVTASKDYVVVEDNCGMDSYGVERFLTVGSIHKQFTPISPRFKRIRTGRFGVGRMSFLAFFKKMKIRTQKGDFHTCFVIDEECVSNLASGQAYIKKLDETPLGRNGSEIWLLQPRSKLNSKKVLREIKGLPILRAPFFEIYFRLGEWKKWSAIGTTLVKPKKILGEKIPVDTDGITGEITIAYRPLGEDERGILIIHGAHAVTRSFFGFRPSMFSRVTGFVQCNWIVSRFGDKSALIESETSEKFRGVVKRFLAEKIFPKATKIEKGMSYEESRVFKAIDRLLSKILAEEEAEEELTPPIPLTQEIKPVEGEALLPSVAEEKEHPEVYIEPLPPTPTPVPPFQQPVEETTIPITPIQILPPLKKEAPKPPKKKIGKRKVGLKGLGFTAIPYEDETDEREFFVDGKNIYINRGHEAYKRELKRGRGFIKRHALRIIASALATANYSESQALDYANKLIAQALETL